MPRPEELKLLLEKKGIDLVGPVVSHTDEENNYYAFVKVKYGTNGRRYPSESKLKKVSEAASEYGYIVSFVAVGESEGDNYADLYMLLNRKYVDKIRNVYLARAPKAKWVVWIEIGGVMDEVLESSIRSTISDYMQICDMDLSDVVFVEDLNCPTPTAILRTLRIYAPANPEDLREALEQRMFFVPDQIWLNRMLDRIRKAGFVVRRKDGRYFLSVKSLSSLGSSKGRDSADVRRALATSKHLY